MKRLVVLLVVVMLLAGCVTEEDLKQKCATDAAALDFEYHELIKTSTTDWYTCFGWNQDGLRQKVWSLDTF